MYRFHHGDRRQTARSSTPQANSPPSRADCSILHPATPGGELQPAPVDPLLDSRRTMFREAIEKRGGTASPPASSPRCSARRKRSPTAWSRNAIRLLEVPGHVQKATRLLVKTELGPGEHLEELLQGPHSSRQGDEAVGDVRHQRFALVHRIDHAQVRDPGVCHLHLVQRSGNHTHHLAAGVEHGVRRSLPSDRRRPPPKTRAEAARRERSAEPPGSIGVIRSDTPIRTAEDTDPLHRTAPPTPCSRSGGVEASGLFREWRHLAPTGIISDRVDLVRLHPSLQRPHPLHGNHHGSRRATGRPPQWHRLEVYTSPASRPTRLPGAPFGPLQRIETRSGDQEALALGEAGADPSAVNEEPLRAAPHPALRPSRQRSHSPAWPPRAESRSREAAGRDDEKEAKSCAIASARCSRRSAASLSPSSSLRVGEPQEHHGDGRIRGPGQALPLLARPLEQRARLGRLLQPRIAEVDVRQVVETDGNTPGTRRIPLRLGYRQAQARRGAFAVGVVREGAASLDVVGPGGAGGAAERDERQEREIAARTRDESRAIMGPLPASPYRDSPPFSRPYRQRAGIHHLPSALLQVALVVFVRGVVAGGRCDLGDDLASIAATALELLLGRAGSCLLLGAVKEEHGSILGPDVRPLPVSRGRVVARPEDLEEILGRRSSRDRTPPPPPRRGRFCRCRPPRSVGFSRLPPMNPTDVEVTPSTFRKVSSGPQKQPIPNVALSTDSLSKKIVARISQTSSAAAGSEPLGLPPAMELHRSSGRRWLGFTLASITMLLWGILPLALKILLRAMDSPTIVWYRFFLSSVLLGALLAWRGGLPPMARFSRAQWLLLAIADRRSGAQLPRLHGRTGAHQPRQRPGTHPAGAPDAGTGRAPGVQGTLQPAPVGGFLHSDPGPGDVLRGPAPRTRIVPGSLSAGQRDARRRRAHLGDLRDGPEAASALVFFPGGDAVHLCGLHRLPVASGKAGRDPGTRRDGARSAPLLRAQYPGRLRRLRCRPGSLGGVTGELGAGAHTTRHPRIRMADGRALAGPGGARGDLPDQLARRRRRGRWLATDLAGRRLES